MQVPQVHVVEKTIHNPPQLQSVEKSVDFLVFQTVWGALTPDLRVQPAPVVEYLNSSGRPSTKSSRTLKPWNTHSCRPRRVIGETPELQLFRLEKSSRSPQSIILRKKPFEIPQLQTVKKSVEFFDIGGKCKRLRSQSGRPQTMEKMAEVLEIQMLHVEDGSCMCKAGDLTLRSSAGPALQLSRTAVRVARR